MVTINNPPPPPLSSPLPPTLSLYSFASLCIITCNSSKKSILRHSLIVFILCHHLQLLSHTRVSSASVKRDILHCGVVSRKCRNPSLLFSCCIVESNNTPIKWPTVNEVRSHRIHKLLRLTVMLNRSC